MYSSIFSRERIDTSWGSNQHAKQLPVSTPAKKNARILVGKPDSRILVLSWERIISSSSARVWQPGLCSFQMYLFLSGLKLLWTCPQNRHTLPTLQKNSSYPNTVLSPLFLESQACLGKTTLFCVTVKKQWSCQWRFLFSLNISFIFEHKQPLSHSCARCRGGNTCYSWPDFTSVGSSSVLKAASVHCMIYLHLWLSWTSSKDLSIWKCKCVQNPQVPAWILYFMLCLCEVHLQMTVSKAMS